MWNCQNDHFKGKIFKLCVKFASSTMLKISATVVLFIELWEFRSHEKQLEIKL